MKLFEIIGLPALIAALVGGTNILVEVTKKVITVHKAERVALLWAEVLTLCAAFGAVLLQGWGRVAALGRGGRRRASGRRCGGLRGHVRL